MVLDKEQNKERMKKERAQKERAQKEEEKKEIIAGVVAAVCDVLPNMIAKRWARTRATGAAAGRAGAGGCKEGKGSARVSEVVMIRL